MKTQIRILLLAVALALLAGGISLWRGNVRLAGRVAAAPGEASR